MDEVENVIKRICWKAYFFPKTYDARQRQLHKLRFKKQYITPLESYFNIFWKWHLRHGKEHRVYESS